VGYTGDLSHIEKAVWIGSWGLLLHAQTGVFFGSAEGVRTQCGGHSLAR
jgi:hypothetical protein